MNNLSSLTRTMTVLICASGLITIYMLTSQLEIVARISLALILPGACIWYSEELGNVTGISLPQIGQTTPGIMVAVAGWILVLTILTAAIVLNLPNGAT